MYTLPSYIIDADIADRNVRFIWDDSRTQLAEGQTDTALVEALARLSQRANVAYSVAATEWILGRFRSVGDLELASMYVEACWATAVDLRYCRTVWEDYPHPSAWGGPVMGSIWLAMLRLQQTIGSLVEGGDPEYTAVKLRQLAIHVLPYTERFFEWDSIVRERLERLYLREPDEQLGDVVPRELFDPAIDPATINVEQAIDNFLRGLDYKINPFLNTPEGMIADNFEGVPYRFNLSFDREQKGK